MSDPLVHQIIDDAAGLTGGKYERQCIEAFKQCVSDPHGVHGVILIVLNGDNGSGFSAALTLPALSHEIPNVLREIADKIELGHKRSTLS